MVIKALPKPWLGIYNWWGRFKVAIPWACKNCGSWNSKRNRQRTAYAQEESNWLRLCPKCQKDADDYWDEMWREYYMSQGR